MKKGFTLMELLAVIIIISIISVIIFPAINKIILRSKNDLYADQLLDIQSAVEKWATENSELLDKYYVNDIYIDLESIRYSGYLETDNIVNPLTKETMDGCTQIKYDVSKKQYSYVYDEKTCEAYASDVAAGDNSYGYIIYKYDKSNKTFDKSNKSNEFKSLGLAIYEYYSDNNILKVIGDTTSGLYETEDEYVFKGDSPNNYVELDGKIWRILSIDKKDYSTKLIKTSTSSSNVWSSGSTNFNDSSIKTDLLKDVNTETTLAFNSKKIIAYDFQIGSVSGSAFSIPALISELSSKTDANGSSSNTSNQKIGTISVLDYVNASASSACENNYMSTECRNNNYLYTMFGSANSTWTLNNNGGNSIWYIGSDGLLALATPADHQKQIYSVVKLSQDAYVSNLATATGDSSNNPYVIK